MESIIFGNYQLHECINTGTKTALYRATRVDVEGVERLVAVKRLLTEWANDEKAVSELIEEGKISMQLTHGNIAQVLDSGEIEGTPFIATEFVNGKELRAIIDRVKGLGQRLPIPLACHTLIKLCEGLSYIHDKKSPSGSPLSLVHCNVSPRNILISYDGEVKIIDLGLAKSAGDKCVTQADSPAGSYPYVSPEQIQGLEIDRRSDLFNLGICLYELTTGEMFCSDEDDSSLLQKIRDAEYKPVTEINPLIPSELEAIVNKALAADREQRYQTASELHDALQAFMYANGYLYSRKEMSAYLRELFSEEIEQERLSAETTGLSKDQKPKEDTGLIAFEDIEPVSTVSALIPAEEPEYSDSQTDGSDSYAADAGQNQEVTPVPFPYPEVTDPEATPAPSPFSPGGYPATLLGLPQAPKRSLPPLEGGAPSPWNFASGSEPAPSSRLPSTPPFNPFQSASERISSVTPPPSPLPPRQVSRPPSAPSLGSVPPPPFKSPVSIPPSLASLGMDFDSDDEATRVYDASLRYSAPLVPSFSGTAYPGESPFAPAASGQTRPMQPVREGAVGATGLESNKRPMKLVLTSALILAALGIGGFLLLKRPAPGVLNVSTTPEDATVTVDGLPASEGVSPFVISNVEPNASHQIEVSKKGYQSWSTTVELKPNQTLNMPKVVLEAEKTETGFSLDSLPSQAEVFLDGKKLEQKTPVRLVDLSPGTHEIRIEKGGEYIPWVTRIQVPENQVLELSRITLDRKPGIRKREPEIAGTSVKEKKARSEESTGVSQPTLSAATSSPRRAIRASRPPVVAAQTRSQPKASGTGTLRVNTRPWSQVFVNSQLVGNTPQTNIQLPAGKHTVTFVSPTFGIRKDITVNIGAGKTVTRVITLSPEG
ncbi:MAG: PEGA domain-containing protein [Deltaproteobacteria bacterium]|nr:PEGA domain-containing protein [Deltaproteobacteria bacterium]